jgi:hypothetical protein
MYQRKTNTSRQPEENTKSWLKIFRTICKTSTILLVIDLELKIYTFNTFWLCRFFQIGHFKSARFEKHGLRTRAFPTRG